MIAGKETILPNREFDARSRRLEADPVESEMMGRPLGVPGLARIRHWDFVPAAERSSRARISEAGMGSASARVASKKGSILGPPF